MSHIEIGTVVSIKMQKTVIVKVSRQTKHPLYKKRVTKINSVQAHDEIGVTPGQKVKIAETKPISKNVHFKVMEVVK